MVRYQDWTGERKQKCKRGFATKREAQEWERSFQMQTSGDLDMTFEAFTELYTKDVKPRLKENTWLTKENIIQKKILPYFGKRKISEITTKDVIAWQNELLAYPYWSWYGFDSRVEWCACFVSWCYNQAGKSEPRFAGCEWQGVPWFQSHGQCGARGYENIAPGDAIFFDWDLDGTADHVGIVIGTDGSRVYTVEGNSGDACKIKSYDLNYQSIKGYGLMNW